ncbi:hypothetical protein C8J57DRAFT_1565250 [Mycena rebaudengoi]|nr:hypothetical protein C8J57DRAFT_1565250 [Mycena rebaudengoi]
MRTIEHDLGSPCPIQNLTFENIPGDGDSELAHLAAALVVRSPGLRQVRGTFDSLSFAGIPVVPTFEYLRRIHFQNEQIRPIARLLANIPHLEVMELCCVLSEDEEDELHDIAVPTLNLKKIRLQQTPLSPSLAKWFFKNSKCIGPLVVHLFIKGMADIPQQDIYEGLVSSLECFAISYSKKACDHLAQHLAQHDWQPKLGQVSVYHWADCDYYYGVRQSDVSSAKATLEQLYNERNIPFAWISEGEPQQGGNKSMNPHYQARQRRPFSGRTDAGRTVLPTPVRRPPRAAATQPDVTPGHPAEGAPPRPLHCHRPPRSTPSSAAADRRTADMTRPVHETPSRPQNTPHAPPPSRAASSVRLPERAAVSSQPAHLLCSIAAAAAPAQLPHTLVRARQRGAGTTRRDRCARNNGGETLGAGMPTVTWARRSVYTSRQGVPPVRARPPPRIPRGRSGQRYRSPLSAGRPPRSAHGGSASARPHPRARAQETPRRHPLRVRTHTHHQEPKTVPRASRISHAQRRSIAVQTPRLACARPMGSSRLARPASQALNAQPASTRAAARRRRQAPRPMTTQAGARRALTTNDVAPAPPGTSE